MFVHRALCGLVPVDHLALFEIDESGREALLLEMPSATSMSALARVIAPVDGTWFGAAVHNRHPVAGAAPGADDVWVNALGWAAVRSVLALPLALESGSALMLLIGSGRRDAYTDEHLRLLGNISGLLTHGFGKSVLAERLLLAAVNGLSKLAESRDPETGDHLLRMSLYSGILASTLMERRMVPAGQAPPRFDQTGMVRREGVRPCEGAGRCPFRSSDRRGAGHRIAGDLRRLRAAQARLSRGGAPTVRWPPHAPPTIALGRSNIKRRLADIAPSAPGF